MQLLRPFLAVVLSCALVSTGWAATVITAAPQAANLRPIIGVLSQELSRSLEGEYGELGYTSYIAASYVKFLEMAGARVVPVKINREREYYSDLIQSINGLLIPGGANFYNTSGYGLAGEILYDLAIDLNNQGDFFPIWGTCLGFELLIYLMANKDDPRIVCDAWDKADALDFELGFEKSKLFSSAPSTILDILANEPVTANFHRYCVTEKGLIEANIHTNIDILATSVDKEGVRYVAAFESKTMPFYAVQFHPEKPAYEWNLKEPNLPHLPNAIHASTYFAEFFVNEARKNGHQFPSLEKERASMIYNYVPTYTGLTNKTFEQCYFFTD